MRTNLENSKLYEPRVSGIRHSNVVMLLTGSFVVPADGPTVWVIDGGSSDRVIRLPALYTDKQVVIANVGTTNSLNITDSSGNALLTLPQQTLAIFFGGTSQWVWSTNAFNAVTSLEPRVVTASATIDDDDFEIQVNGSGAVVLTLPLSGDWETTTGFRGVPLAIFDISGNASANNITINPSGGQTISGQSSLTINGDWGSYRLRPKSGGGWLWY